MAVPKFVEAPCRMCGTHQAIVSGAWCKAQRKAAGLTLEALAPSVRVSIATLSNVETGRMRCTPRIRRAYEALTAVAAVA